MNRVTATKATKCLSALLVRVATERAVREKLTVRQLHWLFRARLVPLELSSLDDRRRLLLHSRLQMRRRSWRWFEVGFGVWLLVRRVLLRV